MAAIFKLWRQVKIRLNHSMRIYVKNILGKFHSDSIWNDGTYCWRGRPNKNKQKNKTSSDIRSVVDLKIESFDGTALKP